MISRFLRELKRRRVLRTASLYVLGAWVALQVVEVLSGAGLPPATMRNLLILLSCGFPLALIVGWFFDISAEGITRTGSLREGESLPELKFIDHVLLVGLVLVVAIDVYILSFPPPSEPVVQTGATGGRTIAVLGFEDLQLEAGEDPVGDGLAGEIRDSLARVAGLRVLGPQSSSLLRAAGENRLGAAAELLVTTLVLGEVLLDGANITIHTRLIGVPAGNEIWSSKIAGPMREAVELQNGLVRQIAGAIAPNTDPDPVHGPRMQAGECADVYDLYLRGKRLVAIGLRTDPEAKPRGMELLREAVTRDERCAVAWAALARASVDWTMPGFVKAGAAARRALELNESLAEAWVVLGEIAEEEARWNDSEEYFLRALYAEPTNANAHHMYSEALLARGRVQEALNHSLEAYRYEPADWRINWKVSLIARYAGDGELTLKHIGIVGDLAEDYRSHYFYLDQLAEGYLLLGDTQRALDAYGEAAEQIAPWFPDCVRAREDRALTDAVFSAMHDSRARYRSGELDEREAKLWEFHWAWQAIRCSTWMGQPDLVFEVLSAEGIPTEQIYINMFPRDGAVLRADPRFRQLVVESGLLDYWKQWSWSDYCEPEGDGFRCD
jgi:TolB-like protein